MEKYSSPLKLYDRISVNAVYSFYNRHFPKDFTFDGERHNFWEIDYIVKGKLGVTDEENLYECTEGDLVIIPPNDFHSSFNIDKSYLKCFTISFNGDGLNILSSAKLKLDKEDRALMASIIKTTEKIGKDTNGTFFYTSKKYEIKQSNDLQYLKNELELLCLQLSKYKNVTQPQDNKGVFEKYKKAVIFLKENVSKNLKVEEISHGVFESPSTLKRIFNKFANCGIITYYNRLRVDYALKLLSEGKKTSEIASLMNFSSQNYFSYFFKKNTGLSPVKYKKQQTEKN